jgi:branched-chain amino acid transport system ATP-binding protein
MIEVLHGSTRNQGEIVTIIGANGAGKTTTLNAISGVLPLRGGSVRFDGQDVSALAHRSVELDRAPSEGRRFFA